MRLTLEFVIGERTPESIKLPESGFLGRFAPQGKVVANQHDLVSSAVLNPSGTPRLSELAQGKQKVVVIVSDSTRGIPNEVVLPPVIDELKRAGLAAGQIEIIVAVGLHRTATSAELEALKQLTGGIKAVSHDAYNEENLVYLGVSKAQTPIWINRKIVDSDFIITIGKVEPHEFAGFTGGRKSILPGVSGEKTVTWNHRPELLEHSNSVPGRLTGNLIHEDMEEVALQIGVNFSVQVVTNEKNEMIAAYAGELIASHRQAVEFSRKLSSVKFEQKPNLIICHPGAALEINLYQALKAVFASAQIIEDGGIIVLQAVCPENTGTDLMVEPFRGSLSLDEVLIKAKANYTAPVDHAILLSKVLKRAIKVFCVCPGVGTDILQTMFLKPFASLQGAVNAALNTLSDPRVMVLDRAQSLLSDLS